MPSFIIICIVIITITSGYISIYSRLEYIRSVEWQHLVNYITFDVEVTVTRLVEDDSNVNFIVQPSKYRVHLSFDLFLKQVVISLSVSAILSIYH